MANLLSNFLGSVGRGVGNFVNRDVVHPVQQVVQHPQQAAIPLEHFLGHTLGNVVRPQQQAIQRVMPQVTHTLAHIPNIRLQGLEQGYSALHGGKPSNPITLGGVSHHIPLLSQAEQFSKQQAQRQPGVQNTGAFIKGITKAGAQTAPYVAPELRVAKLGEGAGLAAKAGAKFINNAVPGAVTSVGADLATGNRNVKKIATNALTAGAVNGAGSVAAAGAARLAKNVADPAVRATIKANSERGFIAGPKASGFQTAVKDAKTFLGPDNKARFEVSDAKAKLNPKGLQNLNGGSPETLGGILNHPELYKQYPELKGVKVISNSNLPQGAKAIYDEANDTIHLDPAKIKDITDLRKTVLHETQHSIQATENTARGGLPTRPNTSPDARALQTQLSEAQARLQARNLQFNQERQNLNMQDPQFPQRLQALHAKYNTPEDQQLRGSVDYLGQRLQASNSKAAQNPVNQAVKERYGNLTGEAEANAVASRANMSNKDIAQNPVDPFYNKDPRQLISQNRPTVAAQAEVPAKVAKLPTFQVKTEGKLARAALPAARIIERQGVNGEKLAQMVRGSRDSQELWQAQLGGQMPTLSKLSRAEKSTIGDVIEGKAKPSSPRQAQAAEEWRGVARQVLERGQASGLEIGDLGKDYFPHIIDFEALNKKNHFNDAVNHLVSSGQAKDPAGAIQLLNYAQDVARNRPHGNLEASRIVDLPNYDKSANALIDYISRATKRITNAETFGPSDEKALELIGKIGADGRDAKAAKNAFDVSVGAKKYDSNIMSPRVSGALRGFNSTTQLGLGAITNATQPVNTAITSGYLRTLGGLMKQFTPEGKAFVQKTGVVADAVLNDIKDEAGFGRRFLARVSAPGFNTVEKSNRSLTALAGRHWATDLAKKGDAKSIATLRNQLKVTGDIGKELTEAQQIQAARELVRKTQFKVDPQDLPAWASSPEGKLIAQFRTFSYHQTGFVLKQVLEPLRKGNVVPLARLMAALPIGYGAYELKNTLRNRPDDPSSSRKTLEAWSAVGGGGLPVDLFRSLVPQMGKYLPPGTYASQVASTLGGPTVGLGVKAADAVGQLSQGKPTSAERLALQRVPLVGTTLSNTILPYKPGGRSGNGPTSPDSNQSLANQVSTNAANKKSGATTKATDYLSKDERNFLKLSSDQQQTYLEQHPDEAYLANASKAKAVAEQLANPNKLPAGLNPAQATKLSPDDVKTLRTYSRLDEQGKQKFNDVPGNTYKLAAAQYAADAAQGKITSSAEDYTRKQTLNKTRITSQYGKTVSDLYGLSKVNLIAFFKQNPDQKGLYDQLAALDKDLYDNGFSSGLKFKYGLGSRSDVTSARSTARTYAKVARLSTTKIPKTARIKVAGVKRPKGVTTTKIAVAKAKNSKKLSLEA